VRRPPNDLTADEWRDMRRATDRIDMLLGDLFHGRRQLDAKTFTEMMEATETIQSTINLVIGQPVGEE
jgi:hypothetical protein